VIEGTQDRRPGTLDPNWNYWTLHGEWVVWHMPSTATTFEHSEFYEALGGHGRLADIDPIFFNHNTRHSWPTRYYFYCEEQR
jgi:hypothetical protein